MQFVNHSRQNFFLALACAHCWRTVVGSPKVLWEACVYGDDAAAPFLLGCQAEYLHSEIVDEEAQWMQCSRCCQLARIYFGTKLMRLNIAPTRLGSSRMQVALFSTRCYIACLAINFHYFENMLLNGGTISFMHFWCFLFFVFFFFFFFLKMIFAKAKQIFN